MEGLENAKKENKGHTISDLSGLALKWDDSSMVRQRLRSGFNLVIHYDSKTKTETNCDVDRNLKNVKANYAPLMFVCQLIGKYRMIPNIDQLAEEVRKVYALNDKPITHPKSMSQAWSLRHLIGVLRGTVRTDKVDKTKKVWPKDRGFKTWNVLCFF